MAAFSLDSPMSPQPAVLLQMLGLKELHIEGELHVEILSDLTHTLAEGVTAIETLNIHSSDLTVPHKDVNLSDTRFHLVSTCKAIARLPCLKRLSLSNCNLCFTIVQLWPHVNFKTCCTFKCNSQSYQKFRALEVLDLSRNGLEDIHLAKLLELFLNDNHVEDASFFDSFGTGFTPGSAYETRVRSWCDVNSPCSGIRDGW
jgi:hypothetical protein